MNKVMNKLITIIFHIKYCRIWEFATGVDLINVINDVGGVAGGNKGRHFLDKVPVSIVWLKPPVSMKFDEQLVLIHFKSSIFQAITNHSSKWNHFKSFHSIKRPAFMSKSWVLSAAFCVNSFTLFHVRSSHV